MKHFIALICFNIVMGQLLSYQKKIDLHENIPCEITKCTAAKRRVVFTFDADGGTESLQEILDTLKQYAVRSSFFVTGRWAEKNCESLKSIDEQGHEIFNHTYSHLNLTKLSDAQIARELEHADEIVKKLIGKSTRPYFRPPYGARNKKVLRAAHKAGFQSIYWTGDTIDWKDSQESSCDKVKKRIFKHLKPGAIYLMHVGFNVAGKVLDSVFKEIINQGYSIVSLSEGIT